MELTPTTTTTTTTTNPPLAAAAAFNNQISNVDVEPTATTPELDVPTSTSRTQQPRSRRAHARVETFATTRRVGG